jgi:AcrR family transcriptional regulator
MAPRTYLRPDERRQQLLAAASQLFDRGGLTAVTMAAVAREARASRRLVYDHFTDLGDLYEAFFVDRVSRYVAAIDRASAAETGSERSVIGAARAPLAVPPAELQAIHVLIADQATPALAPARDALRAHLQARWLPALAAAGVDPEAATALLWSLAASFVTVAGLAHRGEVSDTTAETLVTAMAARLPELVTALSPTTHPEPAP